jgi:hypothetical protein
MSLLQKSLAVGIPVITAGAIFYYKSAAKPLEQPRYYNISNKVMPGLHNTYVNESLWIRERSKRD